MRLNSISARIAFTANVALVFATLQRGNHAMFDSPEEHADDPPPTHIPGLSRAAAEFVPRADNNNQDEEGGEYGEYDQYEGEGDSHLNDEGSYGAVDLGQYSSNAAVGGAYDAQSETQQYSGDYYPNVRYQDGYGTYYQYDKSQSTESGNTDYSYNVSGFQGNTNQHTYQNNQHDTFNQGHHFFFDNTYTSPSALLTDYSYSTSGQQVLNSYAGYPALGYPMGLSCAPASGIPTPFYESRGEMYFGQPRHKDPFFAFLSDIETQTGFKLYRDKFTSKEFNSELKNIFQGYNHLPHEQLNRFIRRELYLKHFISMADPQSLKNEYKMYDLLEKEFKDFFDAINGQITKCHDRGPAIFLLDIFANNPLPYHRKSLLTEFHANCKAQMVYCLWLFIAGVRTALPDDPISQFLDSQQIDSLFLSIVLWKVKDRFPAYSTTEIVEFITDNAHTLYGNGDMVDEWGYLFDPDNTMVSNEVFGPIILWQYTVSGLVNGRFGQFVHLEKSSCWLHPLNFANKLDFLEYLVAVPPGGRTTNSVGSFVSYILRNLLRKSGRSIETFDIFIFANGVNPFYLKSDDFAIEDLCKSLRDVDIATDYSTPGAVSPTINPYFTATPVMFYYSHFPTVVPTQAPLPPAQSSSIAQARSRSPIEIVNSKEKGDAAFDEKGQAKLGLNPKPPATQPRSTFQYRPKSTNNLQPQAEEMAPPTSTSAPKSANILTQTPLLPQAKQFVPSAVASSNTRPNTATYTTTRPATQPSGVRDLRNPNQQTGGSTRPANWNHRNQSTNNRSAGARYNKPPSLTAPSSPTAKTNERFVEYQKRDNVYSGFSSDPQQGTPKKTTNPQKPYSSASQQTNFSQVATTPTEPPQSKQKTGATAQPVNPQRSTGIRPAHSSNSSMPSPLNTKPNTGTGTDQQKKHDNIPQFPDDLEGNNTHLAATPTGPSSSATPQREIPKMVPKSEESSSASPQAEAPQKVTILAKTPSSVDSEKITNLSATSQNGAPKAVAKPMGAPSSTSSQKTSSKQATNLTKGIPKANNPQAPQPKEVAQLPKKAGELKKSDMFFFYDMNADGTVKEDEDDIIYDMGDPTPQKVQSEPVPETKGTSDKSTEKDGEISWADRFAAYTGSDGNVSWADDNVWAERCKMVDDKETKASTAETAKVSAGKGTLKHGKVTILKPKESSGTSTSQTVYSSSTAAPKTGPANDASASKASTAAPQSGSSSGTPVAKTNSSNPSSKAGSSSGATAKQTNSSSGASPWKTNTPAEQPGSSLGFGDYPDLHSAQNAPKKPSAAQASATSTTTTATTTTTSTSGPSNISPVRANQGQKVQKTTSQGKNDPKKNPGSWRSK